MADIRKQITAMEEQTWEALKSSGSALLPFLTHDCIMLFPGGTIFSSESNPPLSEVLNRPDMKPWLEYKLSNVHVIPLADNAASISYEVDANREGLDYSALITSIWRKESRGWKLCLHQQTPVAM